MPITAAALAQHMVDLVEATGFDGTAVVVLVTRTGDPAYADVTVGSNMHHRPNVAAVLTLAAVTVERDTDPAVFVAPSARKLDRLD